MAPRLTSKGLSSQSVETPFQRLTYFVVFAILCLIWLSLTVTGSSLLVSIMTSHSTPENEVILQKLSAQAGGTHVLTVIGIVLVICGLTMRGLLMRYRQRRQDRIGLRVLQILRAEPGASVPEFFVYLRAFETTGRLRIPLSLRVNKLTAPGHLIPNDIEGYVSASVRRRSPLIALGRPGEVFGAARVEAGESEWRRDVLLLLQRAKGILMIPSDAEGTLWEMELIRNFHLFKCVFIMPPFSRMIDTGRRWQAAREALISFDIDLPDYQPAGALFTVTEAGKVLDIEPLIIGWNLRLRNSIGRLLLRKPPEGGLFRAIARADRRSRRWRLFGWAGALASLILIPLMFINFLLPPLPLPERDESWGLTMDRALAYRRISDYDAIEFFILNASSKYRSWSASPAADATRQKLVLQGLFRLDDNVLRRFYIAQSLMLWRMSDKLCATFRPVDVASANFQNAPSLSYMPPDDILPFLRARTSALLASLEDRPLPHIDNSVIRAASGKFLAQMDPGKRAHWDLINEMSPAQVTLSDRCWMLRTMYDGVRVLDEASSAAWARYLAALPIQTDDAK